MILVDASIWIDHFRRTEPQLVQLLDLSAAARRRPVDVALSANA
jgi:hypothetical protein